MINYTESMVMKRNTLTANIFYNKELSSYSLIGNMISSDVSYQYLLLQKINMSSGLTYLDNAGVSMQAGIKQGIRLMGGSHFTLDSYMDVRKNMITPQFPQLYPTCMAELALKYHLKN